MASRRLLTPKQVGRAVGVSESTLKRWCDQGLLPTIRTAGGHRRLLVANVIHFVRQKSIPLVDAAALGLPASSGTGEWTLARSRRQLLDSLEGGDEDWARAIVFDGYLNGQGAVDLLDRLIGPTLKEMGERWTCGKTAIYQERRACEILLRIFSELREATPQPAAGVMRAIGAAPGGDQYALPTAAVEIALRELGWQATSLGHNLPFETLIEAAEQLRPQLFWLSVTYVSDRDLFLQGSHALFQVLAQRGVPLVVGGFGLTADLRPEMKYTAFCDTLSQLGTLVRQLAIAEPIANLHDVEMST